jgi:heme-degrading monooxygenase HmoA
LPAPATADAAAVVIRGRGLGCEVVRGRIRVPGAQATRKEIAMICALTVRTLKPGTFEEFKEAFMGDSFEDDAPEGFVRFNMLRNTENPDEVISFGFFDGTPEQLREVAAREGYEEQLEKIAPFVESVGADGLYEIVAEFTP